MAIVSERQLRDMKRACFMYDCYKCRHQKKTEEEMANCMDKVDCGKCLFPCPCRTCEDGSNWEYADEAEGMPW